MAAVFALALLGCGAGAQRASVSAAPAAPAAPAAITAAAKDYEVDTSRSRFEVWAIDVLGGDHRIRFATWRAHVRVEGATTIHSEIDTMTATPDRVRGTNTLRFKLLEADKYPHATLDATMERVPGGKPNEVIVDGITELHGVRKQLRFAGRLVQEGDAFHFKAAFVIERSMFGITYPPAEPLLRDDVRIVIDVFAVPAQVAAPAL